MILIIEKDYWKGFWNPESLKFWKNLGLFAFLDIGLDILDIFGSLIREDTKQQAIDFLKDFPNV